MIRAGILTLGLVLGLALAAPLAGGAAAQSGPPALAGRFGLGDARNVTVYFDRDIRNLQVEPDAAGELQVLGLTYDPRSARFDVTFDLPSSVTLHRQPARYTGTAMETIPAVTVPH